jgi:hypothetical protein
VKKEQAKKAEKITEPSTPENATTETPEEVSMSIRRETTDAVMMILEESRAPGGDIYCITFIDKI